MAEALPLLHLFFHSSIPSNFLSLCSSFEVVIIIIVLPLLHIYVDYCEMMRESLDFSQLNKHQQHSEFGTQVGEIHISRRSQRGLTKFDFVALYKVGDSRYNQDTGVQKSNWTDYSVLYKYVIDIDIPLPTPRGRCLNFSMDDGLTENYLRREKERNDLQLLW